MGRLGAKRSDNVSQEKSQMTWDIDRKCLAELASSVAHGVIVEIGSFHGLSAVAIAEVASVPVYCIDMWDLTFELDFRRQKTFRGGATQRRPDNHAKFKEYVMSHGMQDKIVDIQGISGEIAKAWTRPIGLLFIDGDHSYEGCMLDYNGYGKWVIAGGYLAIHDYNQHHPGIEQAVLDIKRSGLWEGWQVEGTTVTSLRRAL